MQTSGSEPCYYPKKWNTGNIVQHTHNCYTYALNHLLPIGRTGSKPQPGMIGTGTTANVINCPSIHKLVMSDQTPGILVPVKPSARMKPCDKGFYKMFMMVNSKGDDYHFARQDITGYWSHKPGSGKVTDRDADYKKIRIPHKANWNYGKSGGINYDVGCGYYCVKATKDIRVSGIHNSPGKDYRVASPRGDVYQLERKTLLKIFNKILADNGKNRKLRSYVSKKMKASDLDREDIRKIQKDILNMKVRDSTYVDMLTKL